MKKLMTILMFLLLTNAFAMNCTDENGSSVNVTEKQTDSGTIYEVKGIIGGDKFHETYSDAMKKAEEGITLMETMACVLVDEDGEPMDDEVPYPTGTPNCTTEQNQNIALGLMIYFERDSIKKFARKDGITLSMFIIFGENQLSLSNGACDTEIFTCTK